MKPSVTGLRVEIDEVQDDGTVVTKILLDVRAARRIDVSWSVDRPVEPVFDGGLANYGRPAAHRTTGVETISLQATVLTIPRVIE